MASLASRYPFSGVLGYMQHPFTLGGTTSTFVASDQASTEIDFFITEPGSYDTIMPIALLPQYKEVHLFCSDLDIRFYSDIFRVIQDIEKARPDKKVFFHFPYREIFCFKGRQVLGFRYQSKNNMTLSMEYIICGKKIREGVNKGELPLHDCYFDMKINLGNRVVYIPNRIDSMDELPEISNSLEYNILLPLTQMKNGGLSYKDIYENIEAEKNYKKLQEFWKHYRVMAFASSEEFTSYSSLGWIKMEPRYRTTSKV